MTEEHRRQPQQQLWNIANTLRGKMNADEFRDYILGFIFYKYLSEKVERYANSLLAEDQLKFAELNEQTDEGFEIVQAVHDAAVKQLGYFLKPSELFHAVALKAITSLIPKIWEMVTTLFWPILPAFSKTLSKARWVPTVPMTSAIFLKI